MMTPTSGACLEFRCFGWERLDAMGKGAYHATPGSRISTAF
jgi:hypothetical protein